MIPDTSERIKSSNLESSARSCSCVFPSFTFDSRRWGDTRRWSPGMCDASSSHSVTDRTETNDCNDGGSAENEWRFSLQPWELGLPNVKLTMREIRVEVMQPMKLSCWRLEGVITCHLWGVWGSGKEESRLWLAFYKGTQVTSQGSIPSSLARRSFCGSRVADQQDVTRHNQQGHSPTFYAWWKRQNCQGLSLWCQDRCLVLHIKGIKGKSWQHWIFQTGYRTKSSCWSTYYTVLFWYS